MRLEKSGHTSGAVIFQQGEDEVGTKGARLQFLEILYYEIIRGRYS